ncbi:MAG: isocitrate/isopropylmalate dehydrogenase family protein [Deltaproteobacteria bacterium]|jgi:3-isopropylmalate dehydrogenase|nr:isocitrate/isopropylmalate dehydrogenase family protein [Deltaproteobacteria bacterium]
MDYDIAVIPGDGIGPEVIKEALIVLEKAASVYGFGLKTNILPFGANYYLAHGEVLPKSAFDDLGAASALLLGAVGDPAVPPGPIEQELLLALRFHFDQYLNLRPARSYPNIKLPINAPTGGDIDLVVVRENTEDFYMGLGGSLPENAQYTLEAKRGQYDFVGKLDFSIVPPRDTAYSLGLLTKPSVERIAGRAFKLAASRSQNTVHVATKSNALPKFYGFWDKVIEDLAARQYPQILLTKVNIDNLCYQLVRAPLNFGVILCPNLFGDIVSDLTSAITGGLGLAASGNIGDGLSMFEPAHGSATKLTNTGRANPLATILSAALMLEHLGETKAATGVRQAVTEYLASSPDLRPWELGGKADCQTIGQNVANFIKD